MTDVLEPIAAAATSDAPLSRFRPYPEYKDSGVEWLGEVPSEWEVSRLGWYVNLLTGFPFKSELFSYHEGIRLVRGDNVTEGELRWGDKTRYWIEADVRLHPYFLQINDVVVGMDGSKVGKNYAFIRGEDRPLLLVQRVARLRALPTLKPRFLFSVVGSELFRIWINHVKTDPAIPHISPTDIRNFPIAVPPKAEQSLIASFLDRETAKIDALIAKKERFIELLEEQRSAVISHAVTKGLDPNVPMKDSGIPSIGIVPIRWEIIRNKTLFIERMERSEDGSEELLTVSHLTGITPRREKDVNMFLAESMEGYKRCYAGDVVINTMWAWMGALGVSSYDGIVSPSYNVYRIRDKYRDRIDLEFLNLLYRIPEYVTEINRHSTGIWRSRLRLYPEAFLTMTTPLPPLREQQEIIAHIAPTIDRANAFHGKLSESINELREYRTALISAAVTGTIDVRGEASI